MTDVTLPDGSIATFPDDMPQDQITRVIQNHLGTAPSAAAPGAASAPGVDPALAALDPANWNAGAAAAPLAAAGLRGATFGLSDVAGPALAAGGAVLGNVLAGTGTGSFADAYRQATGQERASAANFATAHPLVNLGTEVAGGLVPALLTGGTTLAPTLGARMATGAGFGAAGGAVGGVAPAITDLAGDQPLSDKLWKGGLDVGAGALSGAALGTVLQPAAAFAGRAVAPLARALSSNAADRQAVGVIANRLGQDVGAGGTDIPSLQQAIAGTPVGKPLTLADIGQAANVQALAGKVARAPGESRNIALNFLGDRTGGAAGRLVDDVNDTITPDTEFDARNALKAQMRRDTTAPYQAAYAAAPLNSDALEEGGALATLMQRPSLRAAVPAAMRLAAEEGRDPNSMGITFNEAGDPIFQEVPSWQTLDYIKRGLDQNLEQYRDPFGRLQLNTQGRADNNTRNAFVQFLDDNNSLYAPARASYAEPAQALAALRQGQNFQQLGPQDIEATLRGMTPNEQSYYRVGAADALRTQIAQSGNATAITGSNLASHRGADYPQQQIRSLLYDSPRAAENLIARGQAENQMLTTANRLVGGSPTAARLAEDVGGGVGAVLPHLVAGAAALPHEPFLGVSQLTTGLSHLANLPEISAPAVNAGVANRLFDPDLAAQQQTLRDILSRPRPLGVRLALPAGGLAGAMVPTTLPRLPYVRAGL